VLACSAMDGRTYGDRCGVARALDAVGERWALLVVRELLLGPKRFTDLHRGLGAVSQNVLSQRLRELERAGVVRRRRLGPPAGSSVYELTEEGAELETVLLALGRWGRHRPVTTEAPLSVDALMLALKTTFDPDVAGELETSVDLRLDDDRFELDVADGVFAVARRSPEHAAATVETDLQTIRDLAFGDTRVDDAVASGALRLDGDGAALQRLFDAFSTPAGAAGSSRPAPDATRR
jgi:DNA-binding HxlR family transcriptional regulator/putative sterol carrier protein